MDPSGCSGTVEPLPSPQGAPPTSPAGATRAPRSAARARRPLRQHAQPTAPTLTRPTHKPGPQHAQHQDSRRQGRNGRSGCCCLRPGARVAWSAWASGSRWRARRAGGSTGLGTVRWSATRGKGHTRRQVGGGAGVKRPALQKRSAFHTLKAWEPLSTRRVRCAESRMRQGRAVWRGLLARLRGRLKRHPFHRSMKRRALRAPVKRGPFHGLMKRPALHYRLTCWPGRQSWPRAGRSVTGWRTWSGRTFRPCRQRSGSGRTGSASGESRANRQVVRHEA